MTSPDAALGRYTEAPGILYAADDLVFGPDFTPKDLLDSFLSDCGDIPHSLNGRSNDGELYGTKDVNPLWMFPDNDTFRTASPELKVLLHEYLQEAYGVSSVSELTGIVDDELRKWQMLDPDRVSVPPELGRRVQLQQAALTMFRNRFITQNFLLWAAAEDQPEYILFGAPLELLERMQKLHGPQTRVRFGSIEPLAANLDTVAEELMRLHSNPRSSKVVQRYLVQFRNLRLLSKDWRKGTHVSRWQSRRELLQAVELAEGDLKQKLFPHSRSPMPEVSLPQAVEQTEALLSRRAAFLESYVAESPEPATPAEVRQTVWQIPENMNLQAILSHAHRQTAAEFFRLLYNPPPDLSGTQKNQRYDRALTLVRNTVDWRQNRLVLYDDVSGAAQSILVTDFFHVYGMRHVPRPLEHADDAAALETYIGKVNKIAGLNVDTRIYRLTLAKDDRIRATPEPDRIRSTAKRHHAGLVYKELIRMSQEEYGFTVTYLLGEKFYQDRLMFSGKNSCLTISREDFLAGLSLDNGSINFAKKEADREPETLRKMMMQLFSALTINGADLSCHDINILPTQSIRINISTVHPNFHDAAVRFFRTLLAGGNGRIPRRMIGITTKNGEMKTISIMADHPSDAADGEAGVPVVTTYEELPFHFFAKALGLSRVRGNQETASCGIGSGSFTADTDPSRIASLLETLVINGVPVDINGVIVQSN